MARAGLGDSVNVDSEVTAALSKDHDLAHINWLDMF